MQDKIKIVTHSSKFHTDDVFAVATLLILLKDKDIDVVRSRDMEVIKSGDYVVDVGSVYDHNIKRYDHHQAGGAGVRENGVPYASFGLVWKHYGEVLCGSKVCADKIEKQIVQQVDSIDNGVDFLETKIKDMYPFDVNSLVHTFAPTWKEETNLDDVFMQLVGGAKILLERLINKIRDEEEAVKFVLDAYNNATDKRLIEVDERYPWGEVLEKKPEPLFVIYKKRVDDNWSLKAIRSSIFSFENRKQLPESWAGKSNEDLNAVTGINDGVFCHNARFLAVAKSKESILKLAEIAINS